LFKSGRYIICTHAHNVLMLYLYDTLGSELRQLSQCHQ